MICKPKAFLSLIHQYESMRVNMALRIWVSKNIQHKRSPKYLSTKNVYRYFFIWWEVGISWKFVRKTSIYVKFTERLAYTSLALFYTSNCDVILSRYSIELHRIVEREIDRTIQFLQANFSKTQIWSPIFILSDSYVPFLIFL